MNNKETSNTFLESNPLEKLHANIMWQPENKEGLQSNLKRQVVYFGNTGLILDARYNEKEEIVEWVLHFKPDLSTARPADANLREKYKFIYKYAIYNFILWYLESSNFSNHFPKRKITTGTTNYSFHNFKVRILNTKEKEIVFPGFVQDNSNQFTPDEHYSVTDISLLAEAYPLEEPWINIINDITNYNFEDIYMVTQI